MLSPVLAGYLGWGEQTRHRFASVPTPRLGCGQKSTFLDHLGVCKPLYVGYLGMSLEDTSNVQIYNLVFILADVSVPSPSLGLMDPFETLSLGMPHVAASPRG